MRVPRESLGDAVEDVSRVSLVDGCPSLVDGCPRLCLAPDESGCVLVESDKGELESKGLAVELETGGLGSASVAVGNNDATDAVYMVIK